MGDDDGDGKGEERKRGKWERARERERDRAKGEELVFAFGIPYAIQYTDSHFCRLSLFLLVEVTNSICTRQSTPGWWSRVLNYRRVDLASEREIVSFAPRSRDRGRRTPRSSVVRSTRLSLLLLEFFGFSASFSPLRWQPPPSLFLLFPSSSYPTSLIFDRDQITSTFAALSKYYL